MTTTTDLVSQYREAMQKVKALPVTRVPPPAPLKTYSPFAVGPPPLSGKFIVLEGLDGAGKSANMDFTREYLEQRGVSVVVTREPGGTPLGEDIRQMLLDDRRQPVPKAELLLIFAARAQHVQQVILPALRAGQWVLSDRFIESTYAYQCGGRGVSSAMIETLEKWVLGSLRPDMTLFLDIPLEVSLARMQARKKDRLEQEDSAFFGQVLARYLSRAILSNDHIRIIDADQPLAAVQAGIAANLKELFAR